MKRFAIPALILAPLALAGVAIASGGPGGDCHRGGPPVDRIAQELSLDETQAAELAALMEDFRPDRDEHRAAHDGFRKIAAAELTAEAPDFAKLEALATAEAEARHARHLDAIGAISDFAAGLSPEQRVLLAEHLEKGPPHHEGRGRHFGKH